MIHVAYLMPHLQLAPPGGYDPVQILRRSLATETSNPWAIMWHCLHDPHLAILIKYWL